MQWHIILKLTVVLTVSHYEFVKGYMVGNNPHHHVEFLDSREKYKLEWLVNWNTKRITFNVTVETNGYVGFGLTSSGKMSGADLIIGGVLSTGKSYFSDRHAVGNHLPEVDPSQDWTLHNAYESGTHTFLSFSRAFDTCDPQDYPITENRIALIWAYGEKDNQIEYHHGNRGMYNVYLLHPDYTPPITRHPTTREPLRVGNGRSDIKVWTIPREMTMPSKDTTYWCTMHSVPNITGKHHIIGFDARFVSEQSRPHVHHLLIYKCNTPRGQNRSPESMFGSFVHHRGQECLSVFTPTGPMPTEYCTQVFHGWAVGGRAYFNSPHTGLPISPREYFVLQVHYDNPNREVGKMVNVHLDLYYTNKLRKFEGGAMAIGHEVPSVPTNILIPPSSIDHTIYGHCSRQCTQKMLPEEGIKISAVNLHSHNAGRRLKLQLFRNGRELPWIASDDNYAFDYQQVRTSIRESTILPGDQLTMTCVYDNTLSNGTTVGGFSTRQEMCVGFIWYYSGLTDYSSCRSDAVSPEYRQRILGVTNVTWSNALIEYVVDPPHRLAGLTISQVSDNHVNWDLGRRAELQRFHLTYPQTALCTPEPFTMSSSSSNDHTVGYPSRARPYRQPQSCSFQSNSG